MENYCDLNFPKTLVDLKLKNGVATKCKWNLPALQSFSIQNLEGELKIPGADNVTVTGEPECFANLVIPYGVKKLRLSYLVERYPDSVTELDILFHKEREDIRLPGSIRRILLWNGDLDKVVTCYTN